MVVSWNFLTDYLRLDIAAEELADRLSLIGLNHEWTKDVNGDLAIDLEVTSNRPDCLSHLGVAREIALLLGQEVCHSAPPEPIPDPSRAANFTVRNEAPEHCAQFEAITLHGVQVGPSPWWLARRLETLGIRPINNVVDVTNYVMNELGQPIHAYDLDRLDGPALVVRLAQPGETAEALNHQTYQLDPGMLVIADRRRVVCLAGVMGCSNSEITATTTNLAIETARFDPLVTRRTARTLGLQSPSSYRFERPIDPRMVVWARNRCVSLIQATGGGTVGLLGADPRSVPLPEPPRIALRLAQIPRVLGIDVPRPRVAQILNALGLILIAEDADRLVVQAPVWRSDLTREVDLIEEVGRIYGYQHVPEDRPVRLGAIVEDRRGRVEDAVRGVLTGLGCHETITYSFVEAGLLGAELTGNPGRAPIRVEHATRKQSNLMRLSLVPSLLEVASRNEAHGVLGGRFFEIAHVYEPVAGQELPHEASHLALLLPGDFFTVKGVLEAVWSRLHITSPLRWVAAERATLRPGHTATIEEAGRPLGFAGEVDPSTIARLKLRESYAILEVSLDRLDELANLIPQQAPVPLLPSVGRDLSLVVRAGVTWDQVQAVVRAAADTTCEEITFLDSFRGGNLPEGMQSLHFALRFRHPERTLTGEEVDNQITRIVAQCASTLGSTLRH